MRAHRHNHRARKYLKKSVRAHNQGDKTLSAKLLKKYKHYRDLWTAQQPWGWAANIDTLRGGPASGELS